MSTKIAKTEKEIYGICFLSIAPIYNRPDHESQLVSQLLFGEFVRLKARAKNGWVRVESLSDNQEGYLRVFQIEKLDTTTFEKLNKNVASSLEVSSPVFSDDYSLSILMGSNLPNFDGMSFHMLDKKLRYSGQAMVPNGQAITQELFTKLCRKFLYAPYLKGGRSFFGIDGPAFVQLIFKIIGIKMYRDAKTQVLMGKTIDFVEETQWGDIAFFENEEGYLTHSGIVLENQEIIHVSEFVRIDLLDHKGIYNRSTRRYTHELRIIKRVINA